MGKTGIFITIDLWDAPRLCDILLEETKVDATPMEDISILKQLYLDFEWTSFQSGLNKMDKSLKNG